jgi:hypothetical protein
VDDVRLANQIRYATPFTPPVRPLVADGSTVGLWLFNEGTGQVAHDLAAGHHATLGTTANPDPADPTWIIVNGNRDAAAVSSGSYCQTEVYLPILVRP